MDPEGLFSIPIPHPIVVLVPITIWAMTPQGQDAIHDLGEDLGQVIDSAEQALYDWLRQRDYKRYKNRCNEKPPAGLSQCDKWRWLLQREKDCANMMQNWDNRWEQGRHDVPIAERNRAAEKLADKIDRLCCND